jgi:hypothetical protein
MDQAQADNVPEGMPTTPARDTTRKQRAERIQSITNEFTARLLEEGCDCVRVFATRHSGGETARFSAGCGNLYAQIGVCLEWLEEQRTYVNLNAEDQAEEAGEDANG